MRTPILRQSGFAWALALSLGLASLICQAEQTTSPQHLLHIRDNINDLKQDLSSDKKTQQQHQQQLRRLEKKIAKLSHSQTKLKLKLKQQQQALQQLNSKTVTLRNQLEQQQHNLNQQLRTAYTAGQQQQLQLLLNQNDPVTAGRNLVYYNYFSRAQINAITQTQVNIQQLNDSELQLQKSNDKLEQLKQQQRQQQQDLLQHQSQRKNLLSKLSSEIDNKQQQLERLLEDEKALSNLLHNLPSQVQDRKTEFSNLSKLKGKLKWPTKGKIKHRFGSTRNQGQLKWQGITISGKAGQEVRSIAPGKVIFADWIRGYGLMLIIDHGHNYMSLYGHNQSLYKDVGDIISNNESIATLGNSGGSANNNLYFEMRHKGKPINPATWCR